MTHHCNPALRAALAWAQDFLTDGRVEFRAGQNMPQRHVIIADRDHTWSAHYDIDPERTRFRLIGFRHGDPPAFVYTDWPTFCDVVRHFDLEEHD
jgi:hypothetical protein